MPNLLQRTKLLVRPVIYAPRHDPLEPPSNKRDWLRLLVIPILVSAIPTSAGWWLSNKWKESSELEEKTRLEAQLKRDRADLMVKYIPLLANDKLRPLAVRGLLLAGDSDILATVNGMYPDIKPAVEENAGPEATALVQQVAQTAINKIEVSELVKAPTSLPPDTDSNNYGKLVLFWAQHELAAGVREGPESNRSPRIDEYNRVAGAPDGAAWSATFAYWVCLQAAGSPEKLPFKPSSSWAAVRSNLKIAGLWKESTSYQPQPGDIAILALRDPNYGHGGIVAKTDSKRVFLIEGNSTTEASARNNDQVAGRWRDLTSIAGYGALSTVTGTFASPQSP